ncbi:MAG: Hsp20/alpha crystallin family protein [Desulfovibrionaceae bacterium]
MVTELTPFYRLNRNFDRLFDEFFTPPYYSQRRESFPPINISEDKDNIYIECEIPGVDMADVEITLVDSSLTIKGERKATPGKYYRQERPSGLFQRVIRINSAVNRDAVSATLKDGLLEVVLPKAEEVKPKKISIAG